MSVTIRDVAAAAKVSISTVSRALAAPELVAESTRLHVQTTARALGYRPNRVARALITGRTGSIGLVLPDLENPFFASVCRGVQARARAAGYAVFIADTDEDPLVEADVVRGLAKQVDGLILCSPRSNDDDVARFADENSVVLVNRTLGDIPSVTLDNDGGFRSVMAHLVALGHRTIAYAAGPVTSWSNSERTAAFRAFQGESPDLDLVELGNVAPVFTGGIQAADLAIASRATAVIAFNDLVAVGILDRIHQRGLVAPHDMSVAGFDNVPVSMLVRPNLTTINFPRMQIGRASVDLLLDTVVEAAGSGRRRTKIPAELIVRESTGVAHTQTFSDAAVDAGAGER